MFSFGPVTDADSVLLVAPWPQAHTCQMCTDPPLKIDPAQRAERCHQLLFVKVFVCWWFLNVFSRTTGTLFVVVLLVYIKGVMSGIHDQNLRLSLFSPLNTI